jgi:phospholipid-translocating ATPase
MCSLVISSRIQIVYTEIPPGSIITDIYGYYALLFPSAYFWLCQPITLFLSLLPRYLAKAWRFGFDPDDISTLRYIVKKQPERDVAKEVRMGGLAGLRRLTPNRSSVDFHGRHSLDMRSGSRTDMATGIRSVHRGFDFATEEGGIALMRMQTYVNFINVYAIPDISCVLSNLSERRQSSRNLAPVQEEGVKHRASAILKTLRRKKPPSLDRGGDE